jgi:putative ABC transport system permease protein
MKLNNKNLFTVTGVISDMPDNAYRKYDFLVPFTYLEELGYDIRSKELFFPCFYYTYVLLQKGSNLDSLNAKLSRHIFFDGKEARGKIGFINMREVYLTETGGTTRIYIFIIIAIIILLIACMNYTNLAAAGAVGRLKEIFTRKVNGAERKQLAGQFYCESFFLSLLALIVGIGFILWFLPYFNQITSKQIAFSLFDLPTFLSALTILAVTSVVAGIYPAIILSNINMRSPAELYPQTFGGKRHFQKILLFIQLTITVVFIISSIIIYQQTDYIQRLNTGMNKHNVLYSRLGGSVLSKIPVLKNELMIHPDILAVSSGSCLPNDVSVGSYFKWGLPSARSARIVYGAADYDYLNTFDIKLTRGRFFSHEFSSDSVDAIVVNEAAMKKLGKDVPVDSLFYFGNINLKLIGVMKDFRHTTPLNTDIQPLFLLHLSNPIFNYFGLNDRYLFIKINPDITDRTKLAKIMEFIHTTARKSSHDYPLDFRFLDTFSFRADQKLESWRKLVLFSSILAIVITCMGLLALTSLNTSQRTREIGIHKVNGARLMDIMMKFYKSYVFWIVLANVIAWPVSWYLMHRFLESFANQTPISWWIFPLAGVLSVFILFATITWHIYHTARRNPAESLKYE